MYLIIVIASYFSLGNNLQVPVFTQRAKLNPGDYDVCMKIAQIGFITVILTCIPVNMYPCREQIMSIFKIRETKKNHFLLTFVLTFTSFMIAIVYPDVLGLFGIFGGVFAASVGLVIPFFIKFCMLGKNFCCFKINLGEQEYKWYHPNRLLYIGILLVVIAIGLGSVYVSIFESQ
jgi:hypothetical protein